MKKRGLVFFLCVIAMSACFAQDGKDIINITQRLLQHKPNESNAEVVDSFHQLHLMIGGNVYQTEKHVSYAYDAQTGKYDFSNEFKYVQPLLNIGDISIVNLKTSFGDNNKDMFSSPDEFSLTLKYAGITAVMHANMHTANIDKEALKRTRDVLNNYDMYHTGAFEDQNERTGNYPLIIDKKGFRIAVLNYTKLPSRPQVSRGFVINEVDKSTIEHDMRMAQAYKPDFIIVYFDWSDNFQDIPNPTQQSLAKYAFEKGADLVVGACPNAPQRIDYVDYFYKGVSRSGIVAYSLGNLFGSNEKLNNRRGFLIDMELQKNVFTNETQINDWGVIPVYTYYDTTSAPGKTKVFSVPCWAVESGDIFPKIPYIEKRRAVNAAYEIRKLLGANADEVQYNLNEMIVNNVKETIEITSASLNNKFSLAHASDIKPSPAPEVPLTDTANSLDKVYHESNLEDAIAKTTAKDKKPVSKPDKKRVDTVAVAQVKSTELSSPVISNLPETANTAMDAKAADTVYRIQFQALQSLLALDTFYYTHLKGYDVYQEGGMYKYVICKFKTYNACYAYWKDQIQPRYKQSFIVMFVNGKRALK